MDRSWVCLGVSTARVLSDLCGSEGKKTFLTPVRLTVGTVPETRKPGGGGGRGFA